MRQITEQAARAFLAGRPFRKDNTEAVSCGAVRAKLYLHGNLIAERRSNGEVHVTLAGWGTPTTRERLNGLEQLLNGTRSFHQKNHRQFYGEIEISSRDWVRIR